MQLQDMIELLNSDLRNEYKHWHFYMNAAVRIQGLHREELREFLLSQAKSEMDHIKEFGDLIVGLGGIPAILPQNFDAYHTKPEDILKYAIKMEEEVVSYYVHRQDQAVILGGVHGRVIELFLDNQILHSREDADHMRQMIAHID